MANPQSSDLRAIRIVYIALLLGVAIFLLIAFVLTLKIRSFGINDPFFEQVLLIVSTLMAIVSIPSGMIIFKNQTANIQDVNLAEKISVFRSAMIVRAATMEGPGFFFVVCVVLTGSTISMIEALVVLAVMFLYFPTNTRLADEMKHDLQEIERISENREF
jgi:hypothetical protein